VLGVSIIKFEDIESSKEYEDFKNLTMSLCTLRKGQFGYIKKIKPLVNGEMFALGWRRGMDAGYTLGHYVMGHGIQMLEDSIQKWEEEKMRLVKWIAFFYESKFMELAPSLYVKIIDEALEVGIPLLGQTKFTNLQQNFNMISK